MAKNIDNILLNGLTGHLGKQIVAKQYAYGTVISKYPDMSAIKPSTGQLKANSRFAVAVAFARTIINDPQQKKQWQKKVVKGSTVYHTAIKWYLDNHPIQP